MNISHLLTIATLLLSTCHTIEQPKWKTQRILLRKLQSEPLESKPLMWNEILADVLVNKIKIFSFNKQSSAENTEITKEDFKEVPEKSLLTKLVSDIFFVCKTIYDAVMKPANAIKKGSETQPQLTPSTNVQDNSEIEERDVDDFQDIIPSSGPKGEVKLIEPRYHGKQVQDSEGSGESETVCPEGTVKVEGECVSNSKLLMAIPDQCPIGYRKDRLGYCRLRF